MTLDLLLGLLLLLLLLLVLLLLLKKLMLVEPIRILCHGHSLLVQQLLLLLLLNRMRWHYISIQVSIHAC